MSKLISIVVPVLNEERNVVPAYDAIVAIFEKLEPDYRYEIIFTDNHSSDGTFAALEALAARDPAVRAVRFARNFGFQNSVLTGYRLARGHAAVQIDCDLQDPPELIEEFLRLWEAGHDCVVGVRQKREEGWLLTRLRRAYYRVLAGIAHDVVVG